MGNDIVGDTVLMTSTPDDVWGWWISEADWENPGVAMDPRGHIVDPATMSQADRDMLRRRFLCDLGVASHAMVNHVDATVLSDAEFRERVRVGVAIPLTVLSETPLGAAMGWSVSGARQG